MLIIAVRGVRFSWKESFLHCTWRLRKAKSQRWVFQRDFEMERGYPFRIVPFMIFQKEWQNIRATTSEVREHSLFLWIVGRSKQTAPCASTHHKKSQTKHRLGRYLIIYEKAGVYAKDRRKSSPEKVCGRNSQGWSGSLAWSVRRSPEAVSQ